MPRFPLLLACGLTCLSLGCASRVDVLDAKTDIIKNDNDNRKELSAEHIRMMVGDLDGLKAQAADAKKRDEQLEAQLDAQRDQAAKKGEILERIATVVDQGLNSLTQGKGPIQVAIDAAASLARSSSIDKSQSLVDAEAQKRDLAAKSLDDAIKAEARHSEERTESVKRDLAALSKDLLNRLLSVSQESQAALTKAGEQGPEQLRKAFLDEFAKIGASKADIDKMKGMSSEALYALLALVLGGGAAGGKVLSSVGKGRDSDAVQALDKRVSEIEVAVGRDGKATKPYVDEIFERVDAIEQRLERLEHK